MTHDTSTTSIDYTPQPIDPADTPLVWGCDFSARPDRTAAHLLPPRQPRREERMAVITIAGLPLMMEMSDATMMTHALNRSHELRRLPTPPGLPQRWRRVESPPAITIETLEAGQVLQPGLPGQEGGAGTTTNAGA